MMTNREITDRLAQDLARRGSDGADLPGRKLSFHEFARWSGLSVSTAIKMRISGTGARYLKLGRRVRYGVRDLEDWSEEIAR